MTLTGRATRLDTCDVSDALDRLGLPAVVAGIRPLTGPYKIASRVVTVKLVAAKGRTSKQHLATAAIEASGPGDVSSSSTAPGKTARGGRQAVWVGLRL